MELVKRNKKINLHKKSGIKYIIEKNLSPKYEYTSIIIYVNVGSIHEKVNQQGLAHFCEHLKFSGTCKKNESKKQSNIPMKSEKTFPDIVKEIEKYDCIKDYNEIFNNMDILNATLNAYTDKDHTAYYIKIPSKFVNIAFNLLFDMLFNTPINQNKIDKEKNIVIEEEKSRNDEIDIMLSIKLYELIFKNHPMGKNMIDNIPIINKYNTKLVSNFIKTHYVSNNMHISISSNLPSDKIKSKLNYYINKYDVEKTKNKNLNKIKKELFDNEKLKEKLILLPRKPNIYIYNEDIKSCDIQIGFLVPFGHSKKDFVNRFSIYILSLILGELNGSRLFIELREKNSWVYGVSSSVELYKDLGCFSIRTSCDKKNIIKVIDCILKIMKDLKTNKVSSKEILTAKNKLIYNHLKHKNEDSFTKAEYNGMMMVYQNNCIFSDSDIEKVINYINDNDVRNIANTVLDFENICFAISGNNIDGNKIKNIVSKYK